MKEKEIGNKLIAVFDGWEVLEAVHWLRFQKYSDILRVSELKYHSSWDWLMPVVEKIEDLDEPFPIYVDIDGWVCQVSGGADLMIEKTGKSKIEAVWLAVVSFIEWFNQQSSKQQ